MHSDVHLKSCPVWFPRLRSRRRPAPRRRAERSLGGRAPSPSTSPRSTALCVTSWPSWACAHGAAPSPNESPSLSTRTWGSGRVSRTSCWRWELTVTVCSSTRSNRLWIIICPMWIFFFYLNILTITLSPSCENTNIYYLFIYFKTLLDTRYETFTSKPSNTI